jgi:hypothetical protein
VERLPRFPQNLSYIPVVVTDACGTGHPDAARRSLASLDFAGDAILTDVESVCALLGRTPRMP